MLSSDKNNNHIYIENRVDYIILQKYKKYNSQFDNYKKNILRNLRLNGKFKTYIFICST
jgi:hypothetical protein